MGRKRTKIWICTDVRRIKELILLFLDTHPVGFNVITGAASWPSEDDIRDWLDYVGANDVTDTHVQCSKTVYDQQRKVEAQESAIRRFDVFARYGGQERLRVVLSDYRSVYPDNYDLIRKIGNAGLPGAKSLEAVAGEYYMDVKTLRRKEASIAEDIASGVVYFEDDFEVKS